MEIKNALLQDLSFAVILLINPSCYLINSLHLYFLSFQLDFKLFEEKNDVLCDSLPRSQNNTLQQILGQVLLHRGGSRNRYTTKHS